jgi:hypothetical protein
MVAQVTLPGRVPGSAPLIIPEPGWAAGYPPPQSRKVFAAVHVAAAPSARGPVIDWEATMRIREHLWSHGFGVAEAMDTAQRGMGLSWAQARELIARTAARAADAPAGVDARPAPAGVDALPALTGVDARPALAGVDARPALAGVGGRPALAAGAGTDQLADGEEHGLGAIADAYAEQVSFVQSTGAQVILMASRALAARARGPRDYLEVYGELLKQADRPVILHWLGEAFDPALRGYWGGTDFGAAAHTVLELIDRAGGQVDGIKLSVLDAGHEVALRRRLPAGVRLYTGDDFNYASLIRGDADGLYSDALLGAFGAVTAPAAAALAALDRGDLAGYDAAMGPTVPLGRLIFESPTYHYKVGVAFLAWLNGLQPHFAMLDGLQRQRPARHLIRVFELAVAARALTKPELAAERMGEWLGRLAGPERV